METITLKEHVKPFEDASRAICNTLDKKYFDTLTDEQKSTYSSGFEPINNNQFNFVARHK
ncbi:TPA: hypothetical protein PR959_001624 [Staphylococcus aureus]|uniref:hypothetical protein n=1 Tax=Mammaliicoccus sciuri TaxID=1296 RepID=UPI00298ADA8D|nr:hypothetical protein [Staphylococcus aureus]HDE8373985.1 hypothetical protein [Staphylococcus aureus]HDG4884473.1 hypothetical protein [Staphylococcus aureus]HDK3864945.1 hypothetical protein [Staphylococcus aureus]HEO8862717.1 hypothetical protein [Staphylococcus aureus]